MNEAQPACGSAATSRRETTKPSSPTSRADEQPTYSVSTWDHELQDWHARDRRATKWRLRRWLRKLYAESWDRPSILIERNA